MVKRICRPNTDLYRVQFDGDKVHGVIGNPTEANLNTF
jgi:hypothetical protein